MVPESVFGAGVLLALLAAFWSRVKILAWRVANLLVVQVELRDGPAVRALGRYLSTSTTRSRYGVRVFMLQLNYVRPLQRVVRVACELLSPDGTVFWLGWRPLLVQRRDRTSSPSSNIYGGDAAAVDRVTLTYVRGTFDTEALILSITAANNAGFELRTLGPGFSVRRVVGRRFEQNDGPVAARGVVFPAQSLAEERELRPLGWREDELGEPQPADPFEFFAMTPDTTALADEVAWWLSAADEYRSRGVPWRMGVALAGPPGTGKTTLARALAQRHQLPMFAVELATMTDRDLLSTWADVRANSPALVLLEDIDTVFDGRTPVDAKAGGLTFGCLLNCLSGAEGSEGVLTIITTNRPATLDPALGAPDPVTGRSTRPGRIDRVVRLGPLDRAGMEYMAGKVLAGFPAAAAEAVTAAEAGAARPTGAQFQQLCVERAFELIRARREEAPRDPGSPPDDLPGR